MENSRCFSAGIAIASFLFVAPASGQDATTQVGNATIIVGGGTAILDLPDVQFFKRIPVAVGGQTVSGRHTDADDFSDEIGWNINSEFTVPVRTDRTISVSGFWANIEDSDTSTCISAAGSFCTINALNRNPAVLAGTVAGGVGESFSSMTERKVDQAGVALELRQSLMSDARYLALGADWRAIYQDMTLNATLSLNPAFDMRYSEDLDTNYYGVFAAFGGDYTPFLFKGLWNRWGLQSSFRFQGGVYSAESDYSGSLRDPVSPWLISDVADSNREVAFIGGLTLETRKRIGRRAMISLKSDYEYYSYVPEMNYNDNINGGLLFGPNVGTTIGDEDAYAIRTSLRLTIGLGPRELYQQPLN